MLIAGIEIKWTPRFGSLDDMRKIEKIDAIASEIAGLERKRLRVKNVRLVDNQIMNLKKGLQELVS